VFPGLPQGGSGRSGTGGRWGRAGCHAPGGVGERVDADVQRVLVAAERRRGVAAGVVGADADVTRQPAVVLDALGGSEDATYLMQRVQDNGGLAGYVCVGTDHPGGHHTPAFDVDEDSLDVGVDTLTDAIRGVAADRP